MIGIVEFLFNNTMCIINQRITSEIGYHDILHVFWSGYGMGTATLEANIRQQLMAMM